MADTLLVKIDTMVVDGKAVAFEEGSATITGVARFENTLVPSASGNDFASRRRVPTMLRMRMQFGPSVDPGALANQKTVQVTARDTVSGRRMLMSNCMFGSLGDVGGGGPVDITYLVLSPVQWL